jgi:ABC-2 type transport system permease protein
MIGLLRFQARRDRLQIVIWVMSIAVLVTGTGNAVVAEFATGQDRTNLLKLALVTPALLALRGIPNGPSAGSLVFFQLFTWLAVVAALMNTFMAARHGRADEEHGRRELVASSPVRRTAPVTATLTLGVLVDLSVVIVSTAGFLAVGLDLGGALAGGLALGVTGFAFLGVGLLASQLASTSRAANGIAGAVVGIAYLLRSAGDALGTPDLQRLTVHSAWPSWLSPIGWGEQTFALSANRLWPLLLGLGFGAATAALALALQSRRDIGQSLLPQRQGRTSARPSLQSNLGLAWRLHWPGLVGWALGGAVLGFFTGALSKAVSGATLDNPQVERVLQSMAPGGGVDMTGILITAILGLVGIFAAAAGVQGVLRVRNDETDGGAELVLATPLRRTTWLLDAIAIGVASVLVVLIGVAAAAWLGFAVNSDSLHAGLAARQALTGAPAALVFVGLTALLVAVLPRLSITLAWGLFGVAVLLGLFGGLLKLPQPMRDVSPFSHMPAVPIQHWEPVVSLVVIAVALASAAMAALRRRDLST